MKPVQVGSDNGRGTPCVIESGDLGFCSRRSERANLEPESFPVWVQVVTINPQLRRPRVPVLSASQCPLPVCGAKVCGRLAPSKGPRLRFSPPYFSPQKRVEEIRVSIREVV